MAQFQYRNFLTVLILGVLATFSPFSIDFSSMRLLLPEMMFDLHAAAAKTALAVYFLGVVGGQALFAPVLSRFGNQKPFYAGLGVFIAASVGGLSLQKPEAEIGFRMLQAFGGFAAQAASMAMARGFLKSGAESRKFSLLILLLGGASMLLPATGALAVAWMSWQWSFVLLAAVLLALLEWVSRRSAMIDTRRDAEVPESPRIQNSLGAALQALWHKAADGEENSGPKLQPCRCRC